MRILGLDLSLTSTGYCLLDDERSEWFGSVSPATRDAERLAAFHDWLTLALAKRELDAVAIEGYSFGSPQGATRAFAIGELGGVVKLAVWRSQLTMRVIPPATWKKQLLGRGNLPKDMVRVEAFKRYGVEFASQDTLDAWAVAMCCRRQLLGLSEPAKVSHRKSAHVPPQQEAHDETRKTSARRAAGAAPA